MADQQLSEAAEEIRRAFYAYEDALTRNLIAEVNAFFLQSPATARFGAAASERQYGYDEVAEARVARGPVKRPMRTLLTVHIHAVDENVGLAHAEFRPDGSDTIGRQSQTWLRTPAGWKIVSAHVSFGTAPS